MTNKTKTISPARPFGAHVSGGKDLAKGLKQVEEGKMSAFQLFLSPPQSMKSPLGSANDGEWGQLVKKKDWKVFVHAPYLINPASANGGLRVRATELLETTVERALALNFSGIVFHVGSHGKDTPSAGLRRVRSTLKPVLSLLEGTDLKLLMEPSSGHTSSMSSTIDTIPTYLDALANHPNLAVCLDTAHLFGAGVDFTQEGTATSMAKEFDRLVGLERLAVVHSNDSKALCGSKRDLHANWGDGLIGNYCLWELDAILPSSVPFVLETPAPNFPRDLALLRSICSNSVPPTEAKVMP